MVPRAGLQADDELRILVTGANSGLGFAICTRLIDEFLETHPPSSRLALILTTRSQTKSSDTVQRLKAHLKRLCRREEKQSSGAGEELERRVRFQPEQLDLTCFLSIRRLARKLIRGTDGVDCPPSIDVLILNAGMGGWTGLNWPLTIWTVLTDMPHSVTWPLFKESGMGWLCKPQLPPSSKKAQINGQAVETTSARTEPPLGEVFTANVFGHYMLAHELAPLLGRSKRGARVIWLSSLEAYSKALDMNDFQGLQSKMVYECTKRITDVLALSSELSGTRPWVQEYFSITEDGHQSPPKMYLSHPGICATAIISLPLILEWLMIGAFYVARWIGSPWHTCSSYKGAVAPVWLALASSSVLAQLEIDAEGESRKGKWGSAIDIWGNERVARTEVEGWGWAGAVGEGAEWRSGMGKRARWRHARDLTEEKRVEFEESGREVWAEMERLRKDWEKRLDQHEAEAGQI
ncbi:3-ketosteroid reductase-like protein [Rhizodiscina lignyota]|uniref:3-ketosteroid reductase-like protein n=1 Tax=Rhizodiscina lignyota TaxID=1504668 RepID=A0A9P4ILG9_9PEZI|nr:3-ketosteroid reductase-like protein [Rhizodiscina lignyota]